MIFDWDTVKIAFLNNCFSEVNYLEANQLKHKYKNMYVSFGELKHPDYPLRDNKSREAEEFAKSSLRELLDKGYFEMDKEEGGLICYPTQKLFDADEFPVGGYTKKARNEKDILDDEKRR